MYYESGNENNRLFKQAWLLNGSGFSIQLIQNIIDVFPLQTEMTLDKDMSSRSRVQLLADIDSAMGGRAAEELIYGKDKIQTGKGWMNSIDKAFILSWG